MRAKDFFDSIISKDSKYIKLNKNLIHNLGHEAAIVYSELVRAYCYYESEDKLTEDGYFFCTVESLEEECAVSKGQQQRILKKLIDMGLIVAELRGLPRIRYIKVLMSKEAVEKAFEPHERRKKEKTAIPSTVYEQYSKPFDFSVLKRQIKSICNKNGKPEDYTDVVNVFSVYFEFFGYPRHYFNTESLTSLVLRIIAANTEYGVYDDDVIREYCEEYESMNMDIGEYTRSIYHLFSDGIMEILSLRLK